MLAAHQVNHLPFYLSGVAPVYWTFLYLRKRRTFMPRTRLPYPKEFRQKIIELARSGRSVVELAKEFEPSEQTIRNWIRQADIDGGHRHDGASSEEKHELSRLRKENRRLQQERDILAKAAAWFARETGSVPPKSSNS